MHIISRLERVRDGSEVSRVESVLSAWLLRNLWHISSLTFQDCMSDTYISKASISRFNRKGGFGSFRQLADALDEELRHEQAPLSRRERILRLDAYYRTCHFSERAVASFAHSLKESDKVLFYSSQAEIEAMSETWKFLQRNGRETGSLLMWDLSEIHERIGSLKERDVLISISCEYKLDTIVDQSLLDSYYPDFRLIADQPCRKFHIGRGDGKRTDRGFEIIELPLEHPEVMTEGLRILDRAVLEKLLEDNRHD